MLTTRLKDDNWALHQIAERQDTPGSLVKGTMPRRGYIDMLRQQYLVNDALDEALARILPQRPELGALIDEDQLLTQYLVEDLHFFETDTETIEPRPGTTRFIDHIKAHADDAMHLLGLHYVRLGACNGNSFVARIVRKAYGLDDAHLGTRYLDPFGADQRPQWMAFKSALDALDLDPDQRERVFQGTRAAYVHAINMDLAEFKDARALLDEHGKTLDQKAFIEGHSVHVPADHDAHNTAR